MKEFIDYWFDYLTPYGEHSIWDTHAPIYFIFIFVFVIGFILGLI